MNLISSQQHPLFSVLEDIPSPCKQIWDWIPEHPDPSYCTQCAKIPSEPGATCSLAPRRLEVEPGELITGCGIQVGARWEGSEFPCRLHSPPRDTHGLGCHHSAAKHSVSLRVNGASGRTWSSAEFPAPHPSLPPGTNCRYFAVFAFNLRRKTGVKLAQPAVSPC